MDGDSISLLVAAVALAGVVLQWAIWYRDQKDRMQQLRLIARQVKALEDMVDAQGKVVGALADTQEKKSAAWAQEVDRRKRKDEFQKAISLWDELRDVLDL